MSERRYDVRELLLSGNTARWLYLTTFVVVCRTGCDLIFEDNRAEAAE